MKARIAGSGIAPASASLTSARLLKVASDSDLSALTYSIGVPVDTTGAMSTTTSRSTSSGWSSASIIATLPPMLWPTTAGGLPTCVRIRAATSSAMAG